MGKRGNFGPSNRDIANFTGSPPRLLSSSPGRCRVLKDFWGPGGSRGFLPLTCSAARLAPEGSRGPPPQRGSAAVGMPRLLGDLRGSRELLSPHQVTGRVRSATQGPEGARLPRLGRRRRRPSGRTKGV